MFSFLVDDLLDFFVFFCCLDFDFFLVTSEEAVDFLDLFELFFLVAMSVL